ncbi:Alpha-mannosidase I [Chlorella vulgaris]
MTGCVSLLLAVALALVVCMVGDTSNRGWPAWRVAAAPAHAGSLNVTQLREESLGMFRFGYGHYMRRAFPQDELRPISCRGKDSQGGIALTLIDSLDTLIVMGEQQRLQEAVRWLAANVTFDLDARVHVFELTIRAVGGMLSAHMLIEQDPALVPGYDGSLLRLAVDLTNRFMPAFDTPTGVPLSWVNLRHGQIPGDVRFTCTACAGTLLLEFGVLSRLTGNASYEAKARAAVETIFAMRSARGLLGNTLDCDSGAWVRTDAGVGAGVDSFYEYLLKAYLAFGEPRYLDMFSELYAAAMTNLQLDPSWNGHNWLVDVDMHGGQVLHPYVWSLGAFWPGLQVLAGQVEEGAALHANWTAAWARFGWLPEMFDVGLDHAHPRENGYPLRPELMESTFLLHSATRDPSLLAVGAALHQRLADNNRVACGYASVGDVTTGQLEDTMESFFLSETVKYLFLLFSNASALVDHFVLSTEGHLLAPFPGTSGEVDRETASLLLNHQRHLNASQPGGGAAEARRQQQQQQGQQGREQQAGGVCYWSDSPAQQQTRGREHGQRQAQGQQEERQQEERQQGASGNGGTGAGSSERWQEALAQQVAAKCRFLCQTDTAASEALAQAAQELRSSLPLLPLPPGALPMLRRRRCTTCRQVTAAVWQAQRAKVAAIQQVARSKAAVATAKISLGKEPAMAATGLAVKRQFLCVVEDSTKGSLGCSVFKEIPARQISPRRLKALPQNYLIIQLTEPTPEMAAAAAAALAGGAQQQQQQQQLQQQRQQGCSAAAAGASCAAHGTGAAGHDPAGLYPVTVEMVVLDGRGGGKQQLEALLADFGPLFEPGCTDADSSSSSGGSSSGGQPQAPEPEQQQWQGRRLVVREGEGGGEGRRHRVVYLSDSAESSGGSEQAEEEEDGDPYEDPDELERREQLAAAAATSSSGNGGGEGGGGGSGGTAQAQAGEQAQAQAQAEGEEEEEYAEEGEEEVESGEDEEAPPPSQGQGSDTGSPPPSMVLCYAEGSAAAAQPLDACTPLLNGGQVAGSIAVVRRGGCLFIQKALAAQQAGAVAVVVVNTDDQLMAMGTDEHGSQTDIPAVMLSAADGGALLAALVAPDATSNGNGSSSGSNSGTSSGSSGSGDSSGSPQGSVRLRLFSSREAVAAGVPSDRCAAAAGGGGAQAQQAQQQAQQQQQQLQHQVELLMSPQAQAWLFSRMAAGGKDPNKALAQILGQLQAHFQASTAAEAQGAEAEHAEAAEEAVEQES